MEPIIRVNNLSKQYRIGARQLPNTTFREAITNTLRSPLRLLRNRTAPRETFWALKDINFEIKPGEIVGFVGRNGAGKSTLLKVLSRITKPTTGEIDIHGRVKSLLEVGTGFHPELTGRENIFLNGALLGMPKAEIKRNFDEIVAFAEVDKFLDTPVKRYSSGMYVRLAFAVAAHLESEILIVDEVLAVGDAQFQRKCISKMGDVAKEGRTVLFVSHNMGALQSLCSRAIWLNSGRLVEDGDSRQIVSSYLSQSFSASTEEVWDDIETAPGNEAVRLRRVCVRPEDTSADVITVKTPFLMEFEYWNLKPDAYLNLSLVIVNESGVVVFNTAPVNEPVWQGQPFPQGLFKSVCRVPGDLMNDGMHKVQLLVVKNLHTIIYDKNDALSFEVHDADRKGWHGKWVGAVRPDLDWTTERVRRDDTRLPTTADYDLEGDLNVVS